MLKNLFKKEVIAAILAAVIIIGAALGFTGVVKYGCMAEGFLKVESPSQACVTGE